MANYDVKVIFTCYCYILEDKFKFKLSKLADIAICESFELGRLSRDSDERKSFSDCSTSGSVKVSLYAAHCRNCES